MPVVAQTAVWVATNSTTELGYRHGGLGIIVDSDTFRVGPDRGGDAHRPRPADRYVLFSVEGDDLYSYELVHLTGNVKLVEVDLAGTPRSRISIWPPPWLPTTRSTPT